jgi:FtsH-binding integral membrane protein
MESPAPAGTPAEAAPVDDRASRHFLAAVFLWVFVALAVSSACLYLFTTNSYFINLLFVKSSGRPTALMWLSLISPFILSFAIRKGADNISYFGLCVLFIIYAAMIGTCFSFILYLFIDTSVFGIFLASCLVFGIAGVIGYAFKIDLTTIRPILYMLLAGLVIVTPVVFLVLLPEMSLWVSYIGVIIFIGVSAISFSDVRDIGKGIDHSDPDAKKLTLICGLQLYVDFVNLFVFLLAMFFGKSDD